MADNRISKLLELEKKLTHRVQQEQDGKVRVKMQCFLAAVENMIKLMADKVVEDSIVDRLIAICSKNEN